MTMWAFLWRLTPSPAASVAIRNTQVVLLERLFGLLAILALGTAMDCDHGVVTSKVLRDPSPGRRACPCAP